jgi:membrane-bound lytic murein transglycosylase D
MIRKKILISTVLFIVFAINANSTLVSNAFLQKDLKILEEMDINSEYITDYKLQKYHKNYSSKHHKYYAKKLNNAQLFIPEIKKTLKENNLPSVFLFLAMAESNFILEAESYKKAMGIWQFIPGTSSIYGLKIDEFIDERMDVVKSTQAASDYLNKLHGMFGKWYMAAIAYNCGEGRVIEGLTRATIDMHCKDNDCKKDPMIIKYRATIKAYQERKVKFRELYKIYKVVKKWDYKPGINEILIVQEGLERQYIPAESRNYIRKIISLAMMNNSDHLIKYENEHLLNRSISSPIVAVQVKGGTLIQNIAEVIGVSKKELKYLNPHIKRNIIPMDYKSYQIYIPYSQLSIFNENIKNIKANIFEYHIVKSGDTLASIGRKYSIKYGLIKKFNNLKSNSLSIKQHLIIPIDPDMYQKPKSYFVRKGDTLGQIAYSNKISISKLMQDNQLTSPLIQIGDKIVLNFN